MYNYIFLTDEGFTFQPDSECDVPDIENLQVIGFSKGNNQEEAFNNLLEENPSLFDTNFDYIFCYRLDNHYLESRKEFSLKVFNDKEDSLVVKKIKYKLKSLGGSALIPLYRGDLCDIKFDSNGNGIVSSKIPVKDKLTWEVFDAAVEVVINNGGKALKGYAQSGAKLGSDRLPLDSVEGYIAHKVYGVEMGKTSFGPGFVIFAILDWAGICNNERGYISLKQKFLMELKN